MKFMVGRFTWGFVGILDGVIIALGSSLSRMKS
jgi:hypothetical protein